MVVSLEVTFDGTWGRADKPLAPTLVHVDEDPDGFAFNLDHLEGHLIGYLRACGIKALHLRVHADMVGEFGAGSVYQRTTLLGTFRLRRLDTDKVAA